MEYIYMRARSSNYSCNENATMRSLCIIVDLRVPVNNVKPFGFCRGDAELRSFYTAVKLQNFSYCYQQYVNVSTTLLSDINHIWSFSTDFL
jgi:hypothetical protein